MLEVSRLVGRSRELKLIREAVAPGVLVTIAGPPGIGKTRLALELARNPPKPGDATELRLVPCDLAEATTAEDLTTLVGRACEVDISSCDSAREAAEVIGRALASTEGVLLMLDNVEQLADHAPLFQPWLEAGAAIVATSRQKLSLPQEVLVALAPLEADAVTLFLDHYRASNPGHALGADEETAARQIVQSLEGLPLAIVLSAAQCRPPLTPPEVAGAPKPTGPLARAIEASWDRLSAAERQALAQCSVFRGGFDELAAADVVRLEAGAAGAASVPELLRRICDKSLLSAVPSEGRDAGRFTMLVSIREFACARLADANAEPAAELRHAKHFGSKSLRAQGAESAESASMRAGLRADIENLLAAHRRATELASKDREAATAAVQIALGLALISGAGAPLAKTLSWLDASVAAAGGKLDAPVAAQAMLARSRLLDQMGRGSEALSSARMARDMALELPTDHNALLVAGAEEAVGRGQLALGRYREAREGLSNAMDRFRSLGLPESAARAHIAIGDTWFYEDNLAEAQATYARALEESKPLAPSSVLGLATLRVAIVEMEQGRSDAALHSYADAIEQMRAASDRSGEASAGTYLGILEQDLGLLDVARARFETLLVQTREIGNRRGEGTVALYLGATLVEAGDLAEAVSTLELAERILSEVGVGPGEAYARAWRAAALARLGVLAEAKALLHRVRGALKAMKEQSFYIAAAELLAGLVDLAEADHALAKGDGVAAATHFAEAERRLAEAPKPKETQSDVRIARRMLARALGGSPMADLPPESRRDSGTDQALVVHKSGDWFRAPRAAAVDISNRVAMRRILAMLLEAHAQRPGEPIPREELIHSIWGPGEPAVLQNRMRVAIATLRKMGLASYLFTRESGYLLDPAQAIVRVGDA